MEYTSTSEAPTEFHFWTGIATIAGALRRRVWIDQLHYQWTPNFYIVLVAPPGVATKSTVMNAGMNLLRKVDNIHFGPNSSTWQALTEAFQEASESVPMSDGVWEPMSCITCAISELGTFLKPQDFEFIDFITDMWDGQKTTWKRKTIQHGDVSIENPWINMVGCTTPSWIRDNFTESMIGGGLASRCIFVYGDQKRQFVAYPGRQIAPASHHRMADELVNDLREISKLKGEYTLEDKATEWGEAWYTQHWTSREEHLSDERYQGYIARKQTHIHKLAMVLAAARRDELIILQEDLEASVALIGSIEPSMIKVFTAVGQSDNYRILRIIMSYMEGTKEIKLNDLWTHCIPNMSVKEFSECVAALAKSGYVEVTNRENAQWVILKRPFLQ